MADSKERQVFDALLVELQKLDPGTADVNDTIVDIFDMATKRKFPRIELVPDTTTRETLATDGSSNLEATASFFVILSVRDDDPTASLHNITRLIENEIEDDDVDWD